MENIRQSHRKYTVNDNDRYLITIYLITVSKNDVEHDFARSEKSRKWLILDYEIVHVNFYDMRFNITFSKLINFYIRVFFFFQFFWRKKMLVIIFHFRFI